MAVFVDTLALVVVDYILPMHVVDFVEKAAVVEVLDTFPAVVATLAEAVVCREVVVVALVEGQSVSVAVEDAANASESQ